MPIVTRLEKWRWPRMLAIAAAILLVAVLVLLVPPLEAVATQLAVISYCMPLTAIGPIILVIFGGRAPEIFLAAMSVFFTTLIGALLGLKAADKASLQLIEAYGGSRWHRLTRSRLPTATPTDCSGCGLEENGRVVGLPTDTRA